MNNKYTYTASLLTLIGGILYLVVAAILFIIGMATPIEITINGSYTRAYLWEFAAYPGPLSLWVAFIAVPLIMGIIGLVINRKIKKNATKTQGVTLLVIGILTIVTGIAFLYIIAGVQTLLASKAENVTT
jgi:hypothetical protein